MNQKLRTTSDDIFRSLHVRNFRLFFTGQLISQTGTWLMMIAQPLLLLKLGPVLVLGPWAGAVADRVDKRRWLILLQSLAMAQSLVLGVVVLAGWGSIPVIYLLAGVQGVLTAFDNPTGRAFVVEMVPTTDLANAVSLNSAVMTGSRVIGPAIAGFLVVTVGHGWAFVIDGLSYLAVLAGLLAMRPAELFPSPRATRAKGQVRAGLRYIRARSELLVPLVMMAIIGTLAFNFSVTIPLLVEGPLRGDDTTFTLLFSVLSIGSLVGALGTARRTAVTSRQLVVAAAGFGAAMLGLAVAPNLVSSFPVAVLLGLTSIAFMTSCTATVQMLASPEYRGRVNFC